MKLLWTGEYSEEWHAIFDEKFDMERGGYNINGRFEERLIGDDLLAKLAGKELFVCSYDEVTEDILYKSPDLKMILSVRDGPEENIDIEACTKLGIPVLFAGGRCMHGVAELNIGLLFALARQIIRYNNNMRQNGWESYVYPFEMNELYRKTLGIVGLGRNGREVAKMANGIGMKVLAYDPYVTAEAAKELNVELVDLEELMSRGDFVTILARVTPETKGMITRELIGKMKKSACLINTGRASLADEDAIFDALENDQIRAAALDVFSKEPFSEGRAYQIPESKLIMTPHIAGVTVERVLHQYEYLMESLQGFLNGEKNIRIYNPAVFETEAFAERCGALFDSKMTV